MESSDKDLLKLNIALAVNYFDRPEVSNSDLKALERMFLVKPEQDLTEVFNFGSLVDAMLTEPWRVLRMSDGVGTPFCQLRLETGGLITYSSSTYKHASKLSQNLKNDRVVKMMLDTMSGQWVVAREMSFVYEEQEYKIKGRCKFDGYSQKYKIGVDYKTTACSTLKAFRDAIDFFDWDQQGAWYMDLAEIDSHWIIGVSKKTGEVFKHVIQRDDEVYKRGRDKYARWAYRWLMLIENFTPKLLEL